MRFGVDFNPAANRRRVISDTGQNVGGSRKAPGASRASQAAAVGFAILAVR
ncbi:hypothetical protein [Streptomyces sp. NBC_00306]|uniref:hypothetical protein n=1 Tax=Streptomyces sp. NBC_00306 TaxID=2975708 RepID=UPI002E2C59EA|nr:hypothetical protein [Streptomyces sp. NBC_00306]